MVFGLVVVSAASVWTEAVEPAGAAAAAMLDGAGTEAGEAAWQGDKGTHSGEDDLWTAEEGEGCACVCWGGG